MMLHKRSLFGQVMVITLILIGPALGQQLEQRVSRLEQLVKELSEENARLRSDLEQFADDEAELSDTGIELKGQIEQLVASRQPLMYTKLNDDRFYRHNGGFMDRLTWGGEWRTRGDWRINTTDLLGDLDDEGFRLDYRFNLGLGFSIYSGNGGETIPVQVSTWIEFQAAGRAANNTAESIPAGISGGQALASDFATRENDLDIVRLYQAYVLLDNILGVDGLALKAGRQEIVYGSQLIMGTNEFFTGTVHDAVRVDFRADKLETNFSAFYAKEAAADGQVPPGFSTGGLFQAEFRSSGDEDELMGLYVESRVLDPVMVDVYYFYFNARNPGSGVLPNNVTSPNDPAIDAFGRATLEGQLHTLGFWARGEDLLVSGLFLSLEFAYQLGNENDNDDIDAMVVEFATEYRLPLWDEVVPRIYFSYYFAEGPDSGTNNGFSPLFISRHNNDPLRGHGPYSRFGNIDLIPTRNIHVLQGGFKFDPWADWTMGFTYLAAFLNHSRELFTTNSFGDVFLNDRLLGHEVDLYARYHITSYTDLFLNLSVFIPDADFAIDSAPTNGIADRLVDTDVAFGLFAQIQVRF